MERDKALETLSESIAYSDDIAYEHDLLLLQNAKLKKKFSEVVDALIKVNPDAIQEIDFEDVLQDPCRGIKLTGILKDTENAVNLPRQISEEPAKGLKA